MTLVVLSLGSNIDREENIARAIFSIRESFGEIRVSPVYETTSVGFDGPAFFNLIVSFHCDEPVDVIRDQLRDIESKAGRVRGAKSFSSRVLDIDIVLYGDNDLREAGYNIPRDEIEKYAYVLKPLVDLYPDFIHPRTELTIARMWADFDAGEQKLTVVDFPL